MLFLVKESLQKTPVYDAYLSIRNRWLLARWQLKGCPVPPPPLIKQRCVLEYQKRFKLDILIETGTYRGDMALLNRQALFWLDAHHSGRGTALSDYETPIMAELDCIFAHPIKSHVILIDDARYFDGRHDYPTLEGLKSHVSNRSPESSFIVSDDIIRISPPGLPK